MKQFVRVTLVALVVLLVASFVVAQEKSAALWSATLSKPAPAVGEEIELVLTARLAPGWIVYSSDFQAEIGPQPTQIVLARTDAFVAVGPLVSVRPKRKRDKTWDIDLGYFEQRAEFRQKIRILKKDFAVAGSVKGQFCSESDGTCSLFEETFSATGK
jgi:Disulphide bond corrector protein DsbC